VLGHVEGVLREELPESSAVIVNEEDARHANLIVGAGLVGVAGRVLAGAAASQRELQGAGNRDGFASNTDTLRPTQLL